MSAAPGPNINVRTRLVEFFADVPPGVTRVCMTVPWRDVKFIGAQLVSLDVKAEENREAKAAGLPEPHTMPEGWPEDDGNGHAAAPSKILVPGFVPPDLSRLRS